jgi:hypothetical protein
MTIDIESRTSLPKITKE